MGYPSVEEAVSHLQDLLGRAAPEPENTMHKYTLSEDGIERTSVVLRIRLTRDEVAVAKRMAKKNQNLGWLDALSASAALAVEHALEEFLRNEAKATGE